MRPNRENLKISFHILKIWGKTTILVVFSHPSSYLNKLVVDHISGKRLQESDWRIVTKITKGARKISPLFAQRRKCLMEAIIVYQTLLKYGISSNLRLGAERINDKLSTHAWIEIEGKVVVGGPITRYEKLTRIQKTDT